MRLSTAVLACALGACTGSAASGKKVTFSLVGRDIDAWVPSCAGINGNKSPLVVSLHAWASNKDQQQEVDRLPEYVGSECAVIIHPQGLKRGHLFGMAGFSWNGGGCCPDANYKGVDDVTFLKNAITAAIARFPIDKELIFGVGLSNGGMMINRFACEEPRIKAIVAVSGMMVNGTEGDETTETFSCPRKVPILHIHGQSDPVVPWTGCNKSTGGMTCKYFLSMPGVSPFPPVPEYIDDWRVRNGASGQGQVTFQNRSATCTSWGEASSNVTLCSLKYEGHAWPGYCMTVQKMLPSMFNCSSDMDASYHAMSFFRQYIPAASSSNSIVV